MKLGFVGLGQMGKPIALNLLKGGAELTVVNRTDGSFPLFIGLGARTSLDVSAVADAEFIFLCLPSASVVRHAMLAEGGLLSLLRPGQTVVDLSTISHSTTIEIATASRARGIDFLDAPVSGMQARAIDGTLTIMCGGDVDVFERTKPCFELIGRRVLYMGPSGSGQLTKLVNQLLFDINAAALAEIYPMAVKMGLDPDLVGEVFNSGTGRSHASEFFVPRILQRRFGDGYPMRHAYKDLVSGAELGAQLCIPMPVLAAATATYQAALLRGYGGEDKGAMIHVFEDLLGVEVRSRSIPS